MRLLLCLLTGLLGWGFAQSLLEQMQSNIDDGYYAVAAQVLGPQLIGSSEYQDNPEAYYLYAKALFLTANTEAARAALDQAMNLLGEQSADHLHLEGLLLAAEGNTAQALETLMTTFKQSPDYDLAMDWGRIAWQAGRLDEALEAFSQAAATPKGQRELWPYLNQGRILKGRGQLEAAISAFNLAIEVFSANDVAIGDLPSPGYVEAFYQLGSIYEALGNSQEARLNYESARLIGSNYPLAVEALERLGN